MVLGPNTLVGLATLAPGADKSALIARLLPAYVDLLEQLKERSPPPHAFSKPKKEQAKRQGPFMF